MSGAGNNRALWRMKIEYGLSRKLSQPAFFPPTLELRAFAVVNCAGYLLSEPVPWYFKMPGSLSE
jgi:hypothetical protein